MKALRDPQNLLTDGLAAIREQFAVPSDFPPQVEEAARLSAARAITGHVDRTAVPFVTLDPEGAVDLDQAFAIETSGSDILLHYAIADVAWFVSDGDAVDGEAWARGTTVYLPDGKASLYPRVLSEGAASLLPDGDRPAIVLSVRVAPDGGARLDHVERAVVRSRAKLAYETVQESDLPAGFGAIVARLEAASDARGAARVEPPEQVVERDAVGHFALRFRPYSRFEAGNAALSLAANLAVAEAMLDARTGLFRTMAAPDAAAEARLRQTAAALRVPWPAAMPLAQLEKRLDAADPRSAAFMLAVRRAGNGAAYEAWHDGLQPWHAALAAPYAHATAPLRRLADRYVLRCVLALANGGAPDESLVQAFGRLPAVMAKAGAREGRIERAVVDLAEAAILANRVGERFDAVVTDVEAQALRMQLRDEPVVARIARGPELPGTEICVRLADADPQRRTVNFVRAP